MTPGLNFARARCAAPAEKAVFIVARSSRKRFRRSAPCPRQQVGSLRKFI